MEQPILALIIPCYNEEECLEDTTNGLLSVLKKLETENVISDKSYIFYIDDGSKDNTWNIIEKYSAETTKKVRGIKLSRNFGNQNAITAGIYEAQKYGADCFITLDADLQQDENKIGEFVEKYKNGAEVVLGIRRDRHTDGFLQKTASLTFYKLMKLFGVNIAVNHSEYRLIGKKAAMALYEYKEKNIFLRCIIQQLGFKNDYVYFDVKPRNKGKSKFNFFSLTLLALNGITSFSVIPLRMVTLTGFIMSFASFIVGICAIADKITGTCIVPGWATIVVLIGFVSGIQILCLGVIAEYLGQLFTEVKSRPRYIIESETD